MVEVVKRKPGRPRKDRPVEVIQSDTEQPATVVRPVPDPEHDPNPVFEVEAVDETTGLTTIYPDPGEAVELPTLYVQTEPQAFQMSEIQDPESFALSAQQVAALDRDFDGHAGGSRPIAKLTEHQRNAWMQDAVDAYEGQWEIKRTDNFNRVWTFRHEIHQNRDHMLIEVRRGPTVASRMISTAVFSAGHALVAIEAVDAECAR